MKSRHILSFIWIDEAEKKAVYAGDTMQFSIAATCFEETPVPQVLRYTLMIQENW